MRVITPGTKEQKDPLYIGTCTSCGCVFEANRSELKYISSFRDSSHSGKCPMDFCGDSVWNMREKGKSIVNTGGWRD